MSIPTETVTRIKADLDEAERIVRHMHETLDAYAGEQPAPVVGPREMALSKWWPARIGWALVVLAFLGILVLPTGSTQGTASPAAAPSASPTATQASASAYAQCLGDLKAEHARWVKDPSREVNPPSCDQPAVSHDDYARAWTAAGGAVWVADEGTTDAP